MCLPALGESSSTSHRSSSNRSDHEGDDPRHTPLHQSRVAISTEEEEEEGRSLSLGALYPPLSEVLDAAQASDQGAARCLTCRTCGLTSRRVEEARRQGDAVRERLQQGKALEERGEALAARRCLEQAVGRAEAWLHRGNWVLSELFSRLASVCVQLQVRNHDGSCSTCNDAATGVCLLGGRCWFLRRSQVSTQVCV